MSTLNSDLNDEKIGLEKTWETLETFLTCTLFYCKFSCIRNALKHYLLVPLPVPDTTCPFGTTHQIFFFIA